MKIANSIWLNKNWIENDKGKRISSKFVIKGKRKCGPLIVIEDETYNDYVLAPNHFLKGRDINVINDKYYSICGRDERNNVIKATYNAQGELIGENMYITTYNENEGVMTVEYEGGIRYADKDLNWIIDGKYKTQYVYFTNGIAALENQNGVIELINKKGETVKELVACNNIGLFSTDPLLFWISDGSKMGVIDASGKEIIPMDYHRVELKGNFIKLVLNGRYGLTDIKGNVLLECIYKELIELPDKFVVEEFPIREIKRKVIKKYGAEA